MKNHNQARIKYEATNLQDRIITATNDLRWFRQQLKAIQEECKHPDTRVIEHEYKWILCNDCHKNLGRYVNEHKM